MCVYCIWYVFLRCTVSFHNFKPQSFKMSVSNPKNKYVAYLSVLSRISNCQSLGRKNKHEILKTDRIVFGNVIMVFVEGWLIVAMLSNPSTFPSCIITMAWYIWTILLPTSSIWISIGSAIRISALGQNVSYIDLGISCSWNKLMLRMSCSINNIS